MEAFTLGLKLKGIRGAEFCALRGGLASLATTGAGCAPFAVVAASAAAADGNTSTVPNTAERLAESPAAWPLGLSGALCLATARRVLCLAPSLAWACAACAAAATVDTVAVAFVRSLVVFAAEVAGVRLDGLNGGLFCFVAPLWLSACVFGATADAVDADESSLDDADAGLMCVCVPVVCCAP